MEQRPESTSSQAASPANPTAAPVSDSVPPTSAGSGQSLSGAFAYFDPATLSWRTYQDSLLSTEEQPSAVFSDRWPRSGMMRSGSVAARPKPALHTSATDSGSSPYWPTPVVGDSVGAGNRNLPGSKAHAGSSLTDKVNEGQRPRFRTPRASEAEHPGRTQTPKDGQTLGLTEQINQPSWPTPTAQDAKNDGGPSQMERNTLPLNAAAKVWPTPKSSPSGPDYARANRPRSGGDDLATSVAREGGTGQLNPTWVEWLMGFPLGWTACADSATRSSRRSQKRSARTSSIES